MRSAAAVRALREAVAPAPCVVLDRPAGFAEPGWPALDPGAAALMRRVPRALRPRPGVQPGRACGGPLGVIDRTPIDDCVHCGFCLPACPTYDLWAEEMDSPRGRIVLIKELAEGGRPTAAIVEHLDNCLGCMSCVSACPSGVRYDLLVEDARAEVESGWRRPLRERLVRRAIFALAPHPARLRALAPFAPLSRLLPGRFARLAPRRAQRVRLPARLPAAGERRGTVALLQGCVQRVFFGSVNEAAARVLAAEGFDVLIPDAPRCCGALQLHTGEADAAAALARATIDALGEADHVVATAAGCGSAMKDYGHLLGGDPL